MVKTVFLDRDGVINPLVYHENNIPYRGELNAPWNINEFRFIPGVEEAIHVIKEMGFMTIVITNQPSVYDNNMTITQLNEINAYLMNHLGIDKVYVAIDPNSKWYKPSPALFEYAIYDKRVNRSQSWMIGDHWRDIIPAHHSKLKTIYVKGKPYPDTHKEPHYYVNNLLEAAYLIKKETHVI